MDQEGLLLEKNNVVSEGRDFLLSDGRKIHYRVLGKGPALLLIHGLNMGLGQWHAVLGQLAARHTVYAIDCLGSGGSTRLPLVELSIEKDVLAPVAEFIRGVIGPSLAILGHSLGAFAALRLALSMPEQVRAVVAVAPVGFVEYTPAKFRLLGSRMFMRFISATAMRVSVKTMSDFLGSVMADRTALDPVFTEYFVSALQVDPVSHPFELIHRMVTMRAMRREFMFFAHAFDSAAAPLLIVSGEQDPLIPASRLRAALRAHPNIGYASVAGAGHVPFAERPEAFLDIVNGFLRPFILSS